MSDNDKRRGRGRGPGRGSGRGGRSQGGGRGGGRGREGGRIAPGARPVDEGTRIDISKILSDFQASDEQGMWRWRVTQNAGTPATT